MLLLIPFTRSAQVGALYGFVLELLVGDVFDEKSSDLTANGLELPGPGTEDVAVAHWVWSD